MSGEEVRQDLGSWISGPSADAEPAAAQDIEPGDKLLYDGRVIGIIDVHHSFYQFPGGGGPGVAITWLAGSSSGVLIRRSAEVLQRVASQP